MLTYKGYRAIVKYDNEAEMLYGEVVSTRDVITFQASSVEQLKRELEFSVDDYLAFCAKKGIEPDKPCSGKISLRVSPEIHTAAASAAASDGKSLNAWLSKTIEKAAIG